MRQVNIAKSQNFKKNQIQTPNTIRVRFKLPLTQTSLWLVKEYVSDYQEKNPVHQNTSKHMFGVLSVRCGYQTKSRLKSESSLH